MSTECGASTRRLFSACAKPVWKDGRCKLRRMRRTITQEFVAK